jgi:ABC-2 type transport system permease protein
VISPPVYALSLRTLLLQRRTLALAILATIPVIAAGAFALVGQIDPDTFWARLVQRLLLPTVAALIAVVVGASALGDERDEGTVLYLASTPLPRATLVASTVAAAWTAAMVLLTPAVVVAGFVALGDQFELAEVLWPLAATALGVLAYTAAAAWLAMIVRRPVVIGVLYILLWEGSIATFAASADRLSLAAYARRVATEGVLDVNAPDVPALTATVVLLAVGAAALALATRALRRVELP